MPNEAKTEERWYPQSGTILACVECGYEDHTGDEDWSTHVCRERPKYEPPDDDIPF